jgi:PAS domain S-box-containing protein
MDNSKTWIYDIETLSCLAVNQAVINHYGYSEDEFLSMTLTDIRPPEDIPKLLEAISKISTGFTVPEVWRHCKKDGTHILVDVSAHEAKSILRCWRSRKTI